jgi:peroxiredoxin family protein
VRFASVDEKLDEIINTIDDMSKAKIYKIRSACDFYKTFNTIYKKYSPEHILINSFTWHDSIKNFKINNVLKINSLADFEILEDIQNIPISDTCFVNDMIAKRQECFYIKYDKNNIKEQFAYELIKKDQIVCSYVFIVYNVNVPVMMCVVSYDEIKILSEDRINEVLEDINGIKKMIEKCW